MKAVAESISGDDVARIGFEDRVDLEDCTVSARCFVPAGEHLFDIFFDDWFDAADAGVGKETVDAVATKTVGIMVHGSDNRVGGFDEDLVS